jgi:hypothetical protein
VSKNLVHHDKLGREIGKDSIVVCAAGMRDIEIGVVMKWTAKMVRIRPIGSRSSVGTLRYPSELVIINDIPETMLYLLKA